MINWHDPAREVGTMFAVVKFKHVMAGLYIWEVVLNLKYEYSIIMRKRKITLASAFYMGCRWCTLFAIIVELLIMDQSFDGEMVCHALASMTFALSFLSMLFASLLVILRVHALWERNKVVTTIASAFWLTHAASLIYGVVRSRGHPADGRCVFDHILRARICIISTFISDLVLLALMVSGVLRWKGVHDKSGTWWLLYKQGLAWIVLFTLAEVPPLVFIILDLNDNMNVMFLLPAVITMAVGASRLYLGLVNSAPFNSPPSRVVGGKE